MRLVSPLSIPRWSSHPFKPIRCDSRTASTASAPKLDLRSIDSKWQKRWEETRLHRSPSRDVQKEKAYILPMFPYPSGVLHMGHLRVYTISDVLARFKRMKGYSVLYPMGWDAFGLPAENAAIERGIDPAEWTVQNIAKMKAQLKAMSGDFDWDREFMTCSPSFYKHTQRIFLMLFEKGLAYQAEAVVNYDPIDKTVLANEQVDAQGHSWRSGALVEKVKLKQWFLRITAYKGELLEDLQELAKCNGWPERVLAQQRHWIGKSKGATIGFLLRSSGQNLGDTDKGINVFTTRPDTLFGAQYVALSLSHPIVQQVARTSDSLKAFIDKASSLLPESKTGYLLSGVEAVNPLSKLESMPGLVHRPLPIYVAPYVLSEYGEGAVMGVPGHDQRDFEFWREQKGDEDVLTVIAPAASEPQMSTQRRAPFVHEGVLTDISGPFRGMTSTEATEEIVSRLSKNQLASSSYSWRLRDWLISRQRYWGTPIPIIHCQKCGAVPVPLDQLPVELPKMPKDSTLKGNPLEHAHDWLNTACPKCSGPAKRDTDTMDTFVDSSWYYMRFPDSNNAEEPFSPEAAASFLPVDTYIGGVEHAILHLLYARFIYKFLSKSDLFSSRGSTLAVSEPFRTLVTQGMVHGRTYSDPNTGGFIHASDLDLSNPMSPRIISTGDTPNITFEKMSKSKHNGVDPTKTIQNYGADATRAHIMFAAPVSEILEWDEEKIVGIQRWFNRLWRVVEDVASTLPSASSYLDQSASPDPLSDLDPISLTSSHISLLEATNSTITSITTTFDSNPYALNTAISDLIKLTNLYSSSLTPPSESSSSFPTRLSYTLLSTHLRLLAPIAPAFADESWERLHFPNKVRSIHEQDFPKPIPIPDIAIHRHKTQTVAIQIDGKLRFALELPASLPAYGIVEEKLRKEWLLEKIEHAEEGAKWLKNEEGVIRKQKRVVVVGDGGGSVKLVNIVLDKGK